MSDIVSQKRCPLCKNTLPATLEFFHRDKYQRSGLSPRCKACRREYERTRTRKSRPKIKIAPPLSPDSPLHKTCTKCKISQPLENFYRIGDTGLRWAQCKVCSRQSGRGRYKIDPQKVKKQYRSWKHNHPEQAARKQRNASLRYVYSISLEQYEEMFYRQFGLCAICGKSSSNKRSLHVDHCHETGVIRELICANCNFLLGHAKDDVQILQNAIKYIRKHTT